MILNVKLFYSSLHDQHIRCVENSSLFPIPSVVIESCSQSKTGEHIAENYLLFFSYIQKIEKGIKGIIFCIMYFLAV